jgi:transposase InsO family protein
VENQTSNKIKVLRLNNGGEYSSNDFNYLCAKEGIKRDLIVPYNPQHNGVVEKKNMAIVGAVTSMIHDRGLPFFLWDEACNIAIYLHKRSPHKAL